jgi:2-hydroxy-6-oxonona-2,4-dienedioate hydrolase
LFKTIIVVRSAAILLGCILMADCFAAGSCSIDNNHLDRGEKSPFMICGKDIPQNFELEGLIEAGIKVDYAQWIRRCAPDRKERGLYLWLSAGSESVSSSVGVRNPETGEPVCSALAIEVPPTVQLGDAVLVPIRHPDGNTYRLEIKSGDAGRLGDTCAGGIEFPGSARWPAARLLSDQEVAMVATDSGKFGPKQWYSLPQSTARRKQAPVESLVCEKKQLTAYVRVTGQQRFPLKVILPELGGKHQGQAGIVTVALPEPEWADSMRDKDAKFIDVNGYRTRYFDSGSGPDTLILLHGGQPDPISPTAQSWQQNFAALAKEFRVIALDNLGHGYTDNPRTPADYAAYYERVADHLYDFIEALGLGRVHLVGHSQGGWPVMRVALDHPELVRCVISVDTVLAPFDRQGAGTRNLAYTLTSITPAGGPTVESLFRDSEFTAFTYNNLRWEDAERRYELSKRPELEEARAAMAAGRMHPGNPYFRELRDNTLDELAAGKLKVPHLVIWGRNDPLADFDLGLQFFDIAGAGAVRTELWAVNRAGHSPMVEYPETFNETVIGFCGDFRSKIK